MSPPRKPFILRLARPLGGRRQSPDREGVVAPGDIETIREYSLVLLSRRVPHRIQERPDGTWALLAPGFSAKRAKREIDAYLEENAAEEPPPPPIPARARASHALVGVVLLLLLFVLANATLPRLDIYPHLWTRAGAAQAGEMLSGQWYRAVTALTLHADAAHVAGNVLIGGAFVVFVCREVGLGLGWLLVLVSGALGNVLNALVQRPEHTSVGFSTAVFAAAGLLAAFRLVHGPGKGVRPRLVPVAAGLALVAMLGSGGERTDLGAHLFGFIAGMAVGLATGLAMAGYGPPPRPLDRAALALALVLPTAAWWAALA